MTLKERRTFRLTCEAPVLIKFSREPGERVWTYLAGVAADVSMEGAGLVLPEAIPPGSSIEVAFLPTSDQPLSDRDIRKAATVVWVAQHTPLPSAPFRHGVRFHEPDADLLFWAWPGERLSNS
jgi:PilZ domain